MMLAIMSVSGWANRVPYGASVAGAAVGGLSREAAERSLRQQADSFTSRELEVRVAGTTLRVSPAALGFTAEAAKTLSLLEPGSPPASIEAALFGRNVLPVFALDARRFQDAADALFRALETPVRNATLVMTSDPAGALGTVASRAGVGVDRGAFFSALLARTETLSSEPITVGLVSVRPEITEQDLEPARRKWQRIAALAPYALTAGEFRRDVALETLREWIEFRPTKTRDGAPVVEVRLNEEKAASFFVTLAPAINKQARSAFFEFRDGRLKEREAAESGLKLVVPETVRALERALVMGYREVAAVTENVEPDVTLARLGALGITGFLGRGESDFSGSPQNRIHNIKTGAARFRSVLVAAGAEFSFNSILGGVDAEAGYLPELVIKHNKTIPEYGGGLCQLSTTVFRAAAQAGLPVVERQNHSFVVAYYGKPGFDATIYPGYRDFRFENDTQNPVLLQMKTEGAKLVVDIFGAADGRSVELKGPVVYQQNPDGSARALLTRVITKDGAAKEEKFYSTYKPKALYPVERNPYE